MKTPKNQSINCLFNPTAQSQAGEARLADSEGNTITHSIHNILWWMCVLSVHARVKIYLPIQISARRRGRQSGRNMYNDGKMILYAQNNNHLWAFKRMVKSRMSFKSKWLAKNNNITIYTLYQLNPRPSLTFLALHHNHKTKAEKKKKNWILGWLNRIVGAHKYIQLFSIYDAR